MGHRASDRDGSFDIFAVIPDGDALQQLGSMADPLVRFSPGEAAQAVFDSLDWFFVPLSGWRPLRAAGPTIHLESLPLCIEARVPSAQEFFRLRALLLTANKAVEEEAWEAASYLHAHIFSQPFIMDELLTASASYQLFYGAGGTQYSLGAVRSAIVFWKKAAACNPNQPFVHANLGAALAELGEHTEALKYLRRAHDLQPNQRDVLYNLGVTYIRLLQYTEAIACFRQRLDLQPDADTYTNLAAAYQLSGQAELAEESLRLALELSPDHSKAKQALESVGTGP